MKIKIKSGRSVSHKIKIHPRDEANEQETPRPNVAMQAKNVRNPGQNLKLVWG